ncbi:hypothetical protein LCGC14_0601050 [marine sediment metagenome]|uniref:Uncharacterized protein n=1 Tax=marine sediment metagenome TaxID=412755 RepID=A0A0F9RFC6_9ZZZZ
MNRPTPDQIQRFIAKLLGWTDICEPCAKSGDFHGVPPNKADQEKGVYRKIIRKTMPNWPGDRNASYKLIEDLFRPYQDERDALSAEEECMLYIRDKGYRWETCDSCEGQPHGVSEDCTDCNGQGGKFVKEVTDE